MVEEGGGKIGNSKEERRGKGGGEEGEEGRVPVSAEKVALTNQ